MYDSGLHRRYKRRRRDNRRVSLFGILSIKKSPTAQEFRSASDLFYYRSSSSDRVSPSLNNFLTGAASAAYRRDLYCLTEPSEWHENQAM